MSTLLRTSHWPTCTSCETSSAVTDKGICLSRMSKPQRRSETALTKFVWEALGEKIVHETASP